MENVSPMLRVGVDIGGTFTDLVFLHPDGSLEKRKVPSTPSDFSQAIVEGVVSYCAERQLGGGAIAEIVHATTIATNAILERKGARIALITTDGFRDVLELRRIRIPLSYDITWDKPPPLVERELRFEAPERVTVDGDIHIPFDPASLEPVVQQLRDAKVEAIAVCFLHSYRQPRHERQAGAFLGERLPGMHISLSCDVLPEMLEYERTSTTVTNAYLAPLVGRYLVALRAKLAERGVAAPILVMQSNGGLVSAGYAADRPVTIIESGPAAGVVAAAHVMRKSERLNVITLDMGGTTTKASIIERGAILRASEYEVGSPISVTSRLMRGSGYLLRIPVIDIAEVGAGGGSIAAIDPGGALRVGPESAGAVPGPACYGHGNDRPTVTDANLVLSYINPDSLAGGALSIHPRLADAAIKRGVAVPSGLSVRDAAYGIHVVANSNMVRAIKSVSVERGRDPRDFVIMAFGGAGPIHAAAVARSLGVRHVLVPPAPGVFSAAGLLAADIQLHATRTVLSYSRTGDLDGIQAAFDDMEAQLVARLGDEGFPSSDVSTSASVDICYRGQSSELTVPCVRPVTASTLRAAEEIFEREYERTYGHRSGSKVFDLVSCRLVATVARQVAAGSRWIRAKGEDVRQLPSRQVYFGPEHGLLRTEVIVREALREAPRQGPLLIQEYDTTIVVPPFSAATLDAASNVVVELEQAS